MAGTDVAAVHAAVTVNGTAEGYIGVANSAVFFKGAKCFMNVADGSSPVEVQITDINGGGANTVGLRLMRPRIVDLVNGVPMNRPLFAPNYGQSDASAFTVAGGWTIDQPSQFIYD